MNRTFRFLLSAATLVAMPLASHADAPRGAVEACSQAFIEYLSTTHGPANYRFVPPDSSGPDAGSLSARTSRRVEVDLVATSTSTGKVIARGECTATHSGKLLAMSSRPATASKTMPTRVSTRTAR